MKTPKNHPKIFIFSSFLLLPLLLTCCFSLCIQSLPSQTPYPQEAPFFFLQALKLHLLNTSLYTFNCGEILIYLCAKIFSFFSSLLFPHLLSLVSVRTALPSVFSYGCVQPIKVVKCCPPPLSLSSLSPGLSVSLCSLSLSSFFSQYFLLKLIS